MGPMRRALPVNWPPGWHAKEHMHQEGIAKKRTGCMSKQGSPTTGACRSETMHQGGLLTGA
eukprot:1124338-Pelagomonas_calceolata.AAC.6